MDTLPTRALTGQLADDLGWLEQHARQQPDHGRAAGQLRLAAGLVRNVLGPFLDDQPSSPLHVVVVGGAGAGKSTVANMLAGAVAAEANPQAGFTRHPIAYTSSSGAINWAAHVGFLGPLARMTTPSPSSLDEDVYQVRRVQADPASYDLLKEWVVWDCPDMTTWAAEGYVSRLIEAAALADVIVYAASDERYNDEIPTQFLKMLLETGKPVVCCLMKMREADAEPLTAHFRKEVVNALPDGLGRGVMAVLPIPFLSAKQLADPVREATKYRIPLLNQVAVLGNPASALRKRSVGGACRYLRVHQEELIGVAKLDVETLQRWQNTCQSGQAEFEARYHREYLSSEKFRGFDEALVRLMELLDFPGIGQVLSGTLYVLRTPYRLVRDWMVKTLKRPDAPARPEQPILEEALKGWLDLLHREAARRGSEHALWEHVNRGFQSETFVTAAREKFAQLYREFQGNLSVETDRTARAIYEELKKKPVLLNSLRGGKVAIDAAAIAGTIAAVPGLWWNVVLIPLVASLTHQLVELMGRSVVDSQREMARSRQLALMHQHLGAPLAEWLARWPATGGSSFERLQLALTRLPASIAQVEARVRQVALTHG
jgi:energy-coupling factor transporter ATP-binding protein EcfA2